MDQALATQEMVASNILINVSTYIFIRCWAERVPIESTFKACANGENSYQPVHSLLTYLASCNILRFIRYTAGDSVVQ